MKTKSDELEELTANIVLLDTTLAQYGPETNTARHLLRLALKTVAYRIWRENRAAHDKREAFEASGAALSLYNEILKLSPKDECLGRAPGHDLLRASPCLPTQMQQRWLLSSFLQFRHQLCK